MKKLCLTLLCATALSISSLTAHATNTPPISQTQKTQFIKNMKKHHKQMETKIADELQLTTEQQEKSKQLREKSRKKIKPLMQEMKEIRKKIDTIRQENMKEFESLLTPEQKTKFDKIKAERKAKFDKKKIHHHKPIPPLPME